MSVVQEPLPNWFAQAACSPGNNRETLVATDGLLVEADWFMSDRCDEIDLAKQICAVCSIQEDCLEYAIKKHKGHGVWGGRTERERRQLIYRRARGK